MSDLISRQTAIDAILTEVDEIDMPNVESRWWNMGMMRASKILEHLPSAQPEIVRCKDCKNWDTEWQNDWAKNYHYCPMIDGTRAGDWFCADAERKEDGRFNQQTGGD